MFDVARPPTRASDAERIAFQVVSSHVLVRKKSKSYRSPANSSTRETIRFLATPDFEVSDYQKGTLCGGIRDSEIDSNIPDSCHIQWNDFVVRVKTRVFLWCNDGLFELLSTRLLFSVPHL